MILKLAVAEAKFAQALREVAAGIGVNGDEQPKVEYVFVWSSQREQKLTVY
jgi:hypothetical protein